MAESIAFILVKQLVNLLDEAKKHARGLRGELQFIKDEFERMIAFLRVAEAVEEKDPEVAVWVRQVREVAHDTEDVLDEYDLLLSSRHGCPQSTYAFVKNMRAYCRLASEIRSIKIRVRDISDRHQRYHGKYEIQEQASRSGFVNYIEDDRRGAALLQDEASLVGIRKPKGELVTLLLDGNPKFKVVSVVGMGGLGKTTLVKSVYEDVNVKSQFHCHAWVTVSKSFNIKELLKNLIEQLYAEIKETVPQHVQSMDDNGLKAFTKKFLLHRRSIIVFDDVWDIESWNCIECVLPNNSYICRVMLTTRVMDVALASCTNSPGCVYKMKTLSPEESWILFCRKAFKDSRCPSHLKNISESILNKCSGLPLAIVAIGGILTLKDQRLDDWEMIYRSIGVELEGEGKLERVKKILLLSFFDLPHHLKICLLYLSIFPEDQKMNCMKVIRLWVAEGFVQEREGLTIEEVGKSYLHELVNRSLLQVGETRHDGTLNTCRVHDILREIILSKSREQNVVRVLCGKAIKWSNEVRRLAIHGPTENTTKESSNFKHLRSLLLFSPEDSLPKSFLSNMLCGGSRHLKVLDLSGAPLEMIPGEVFKLFYLRYLSLRGTKVKIIPKFIGKLQNLETLDLKHTSVTELPVEILSLHRLRHLIVYSYNMLTTYYPHNRIQSFRAPYKIGSLVFLQKLSYIEADEKDGVKIVREIGKLTELRRLGITKLRREDGKDLCSSLQRLTNLRSLYVTSIEEDEIIDLQHTLSASPHLLRTLVLTGRLEKLPLWIPSLEGLTKLWLEGSKLKDEPLQYLEDLPNLVDLCLYHAYEGEGLHFKAGKLQRLKVLLLGSLKGLRWVRVEKSSMPCLQELRIADSKLMEELPSGIEHLRKLQYLDLIDMAEQLIASLLNRESRITQAKIYVANWKNGQWERCVV